MAGRALGPATTGSVSAATQMSAGTVIGSVGTGATGYNYVPVSISSTAAPWATLSPSASVSGRSQDQRSDLRRHIRKALLALPVSVTRSLSSSSTYLLVAQSAAANIMQVLIGWEYVPALVIAAIVTIVYTGAAGLLGDAYTDLISGI